MYKANSSLTRKLRQSDLRQRHGDPVTKSSTSRAFERNLSPLEMFRMTMDGESPEEEIQSPVDSQSNEIESISQTSSQTANSPVDHDHAEDNDYYQSESYTETTLNNQTTEIRVQESPAVMNREKSETKLNSKFPFKQCCKMLVSARRTLCLADMSIISKEKFFKNAQYLSKPVSTSIAKSTRRKETKPIQDRANMMNSKLEEASKTPLPLQVPTKTRRIAAVMTCLSPGDGKQRQSLDSMKDHNKSSTRSRPMPRIDSPNQLRRSASHNLDSPERSQSSVSSNRFKRSDSRGRSSRKGFLKKIMSLADPSTEVASFEGSSEEDTRLDSPDPGFSSSTSSSRNSSCLRHPSREKRRPRGTSQEKDSHSPSAGGRMTRSMNKVVREKERNDVDRSGKATETGLGSSHQGFTAFVPFQGFAAFANQGGRAHSCTHGQSPCRCCS